MKVLLENEDRALQRWAVSQIPYMGQPTNCFAMGIATDSDELLAVCMYFDYSPKFRHMQMGIATTSPRWATPGNLGLVFKYPFIDCECVRVTALCARKNKRIRRFVKGIGFKEEGTHPLGLYPDDCISYGMLRPQAERWLMRLEGFKDAALPD